MQHCQVADRTFTMSSGQLAQIQGRPPALQGKGVRVRLQVRAAPQGSTPAAA
jgi:hypothetical protein